MENWWNERNLKGPVNNTRLHHAPDLGINPFFRYKATHFNRILFQIYRNYGNILSMPLAHIQPAILVN